MREERGLLLGRERLKRGEGEGGALNGSQAGAKDRDQARQSFGFMHPQGQRDGPCCAADTVGQVIGDAGQWPIPQCVAIIG